MGIKLTCSLIDENEVYRFDFVLIFGTFPRKPICQSRRRNRRTRCPTSRLTKSRQRSSIRTKTSSQKRNRYLLQPTTKERSLRSTIRSTLQPNPTKEHRVRSNATKGR